MSQLTSESRAQPIALSYVATPSWAHRLPHKRIVIAAALISLALASVLWGKNVRDRILLLYWQSRCLNHEAPADEPRPGSIEWIRFCSLYSPPGSVIPRTAGYIHHRASRSGKSRLIAVLELKGPQAETLIVSRVIAPGGVFSRPREIEGSRPALVFPLSQVLYGRSDPNDSSHFTFSIDIDSERHVIDGWLCDDDTVRLEPREPITSSPSSISPLPHASEATAERRTSGR